MFPEECAGPGAQATINLNTEIITQNMCICIPQNDTYPTHEHLIFNPTVKAPIFTVGKHIHVVTE